MSRNVTTVTPKTTLRHLWKLIFELHIHAIPVINEKKKVIGMVAKADLIKPPYPDYEEYVEDFMSASDFEKMEARLDELSGLTAEKLMSKRVVFARPETPIMRALSRMIVHHVDQLPIIHDEETVVGVITKGDIFAALFKNHFGKKEKKKK